MTKSCATHQGQGRDLGRGAALALQGEGVHGAIPWGVLDRPLKEGLQVDAVCGMSSGVRVGIMSVQGFDLYGGGDLYAVGPGPAALRERGPPPVGDTDFCQGHDPVIPITPRLPIWRYHAPTSQTPAAHQAAARDSAEPCG
jgi:hypothetical protein